MDILIYFLKSSVLLVMFYVVYHLLLKRDTYHEFKRFYLLGGLILSAIMPWIYYTKIVFVPKGNTSDVLIPIQNITRLSEAPSIGHQVENTLALSWDEVLLMVYVLVAAVLLLRFIHQFFKLYQLLRQTPYKILDTHNLHIFEGSVSPFSFFKHILISRTDYESENFKMILAHEKVHINQYHSVDILLANLLCILFWFNPFVWVCKTAIVQNLEHIADSVSVKILSDKLKYQYLLLNHTFQNNHSQSLQTTFFQSSIKQRIMMLNKSKTSKFLSLKSLLMIPILVLFILNFQVEIIAQEQETIQKSYSFNSIGQTDKSLLKLNTAEKRDPFDINNYTSPPTFIDNNTFVDKNSIKDYKIIVQISKDADQKYLNGTKKTMKEKYGFDVEYDMVKFNDKGVLISIEVNVNCNDGFTGSTRIIGDEPISDIYFYRDYTESTITPFGIGGENLLTEQVMKNPPNGSKIFYFPGTDRTSFIKKDLNTKPNAKTYFIDKNNKSKNKLKAETASKFVSLNKVKTFIINGESYELEELKNRKLIVESFQFINDETLEIYGEFKDDLLDQDIEVGNKLTYKNLNLILFGEFDSPIFIKLEKVSIEKKQP